MNNGNFKVRCISFSNIEFTYNKIYEVFNGRIKGECFIHSSYYSIDELNNSPNIRSQFELVEENENKINDLRELIKPCMLVRCKDSLLRMVVQCDGGRIIKRFDAGGWINISDYSNSLKFIERTHEQLDIIEIYSYDKVCSNSLRLSIKSRELIWKREEKSPQQIEIEEIEKQQRELADRLAKLRGEM